VYKFDLLPFYENSQWRTVAASLPFASTPLLHYLVPLGAVSVTVHAMQENILAGDQTIFLSQKADYRAVEKNDKLTISFSFIWNSELKVASSSVSWYSFTYW
jgi:hypothetical protein